MAMWEVTQRFHGEAYPDLNVIQNKPADYPFDPRHAETTGDVTSHKADRINALMNDPVNKPDTYQPWNAQQEIARGAAKDMNSKLIPMLEAKGADAGTIAQAQAQADFLSEVGKGHISPTQADAIANQQFGSTDGVTGLNSRTAAAITTATKWQPQLSPPPVPSADLGGAVKPITKIVLAGVKLDKMETSMAATQKSADEMARQ
jgi:hypothetical protein